MRKMAMNETERLLDLKALLLNEMNEENLIFFCTALLHTHILMPCGIDMQEIDTRELLSSKRGDVMQWGGPDFEPVFVRFNDKKWLAVYSEKRAMPEQYRHSCIRMSGVAAVETAHKQKDTEGLILDPDGNFIPLPLFYLDALGRSLKEHKGE